MSRAPRILVVEGDPSAAQLLARIFEVDDYDVCIAHDVGYALELARFQKTDAILIDLEVPKTVGRALLFSLHADATLRDIPVVLLSNALDAAMLGASAIVSKPLSCETLLQLLHRVHRFTGPPSTEPDLPPRSHRGISAS